MEQAHNDVVFLPENRLGKIFLRVCVDTTEHKGCFEVEFDPETAFRFASAMVDVAKASHDIRPRMN